MINDLCWWWAEVSNSSTLGTPTRSHVTGRKPSHRSAFRSATPPFTEWMTRSYGHNADNLSIAEIIATPGASVYITPLSASQLWKERRFVERLDMFIWSLCNNTWHSNGDSTMRTKWRLCSTERFNLYLTEIPCYILSKLLVQNVDIDIFIKWNVTCSIGCIHLFHYNGAF